MSRISCFLVLMFTLSALPFAHAQAAPQTASTSAVPHVVNFNGTLTAIIGKSRTETTGVTFLLYRDQTGGAPLWLETQNIHPDHQGHYTATLGTNTALPADIFTAAEARWLAVQPEGQPEQPRVLLVAVPYALKAADAETIGGLPPSAFVLAAPPIIGSTQAATAVSAAASPTAPPPVSGTGTTNFVPLWLDAAGTLGNSVLFQSGTGATAKIGINTNTPATTLDVKGAETVRGIFSLPATGVATATAGKASQPASMIASAFNSGTSTAVNEAFRWQAEPTGNNTTTTSGSMNLLFGQGSAAPAETGFKITGNGLVTFAGGQTFPGTGPGTITGVTAGTNLTGGGSAGNVTLNLDTTKVPQLTGDNVFNGNQNIIGNIAANGAINATSANFTSPGTALVAQISLNGIGFPAILGRAISAGESGTIGVEGTAAAGNGFGVVGINTAVGGVGVQGQSPNGNGVGVQAFGGLGSTGVQAGSDLGSAGTFANSSTQASTVTISNQETTGPLMEVISGFLSSFDVLKVTPAQVSVGAITSPAIKLGVGTQSPAALLDVFANTTGTHDPIAQFGSTTTTDQNAIKTYNGTGNTEMFTAGKTNGFVPGTAAGDGGLRVNPGQKILFGDSGLARMSIDASGNVKVTGTLSKGGGSFKIDHPLDPLNKYLYHSFVESPDMMNVYNGNVVTNKRGEAVITMPDYFEALNRDFRYQLTVIGQFAQAIVAKKMSNNRFVIRTNKPSVEVSWQVTGIRQDAYANANAHRIPVEEAKPGAEQGSYLHPDAYPSPIVEAQKR